MDICLTILKIKTMAFMIHPKFINIYKTFPSKEKFHSSLSDTKIYDKKYHHVLNFWNKFEMKIIKDYHDFLLKCDVLFLADVIEKFRNRCLEN